jgi:hypothetical protein
MANGEREAGAGNLAKPSRACSLTICLAALLDVRKSLGAFRLLLLGQEFGARPDYGPLGNLRKHLVGLRYRLLVPAGVAVMLDFVFRMAAHHTG